MEDNEYKINIWWIKAISAMILIALIFLIVMFVFIELMICGMGV